MASFNLFGRKNVRIHVEEHKALTTPQSGEQRMQNQSATLKVWGIQTTSDDGTVTSWSHMVGAGEGTEANTDRELVLVRNQFEELGRKFDEAISQLADMQAKRQRTAERMRALRAKSTPPSVEAPADQSAELAAAYARIKDLELQAGVTEEHFEYFD